MAQGADGGVRTRRVLGPAAAMLLAAPALAVAQDAAAAARPSFLQVLSENAVGLSILFIFATAVIGAVLTQRRRDRVLKSFDKFPATAVLRDGRRVWGRLGVYPNGMAFRFAATHRNSSGNDIDSFIIYSSEFGGVRAVQRVLSELTEGEKRRRELELRRAHRPSLWRRLRRWLWRQLGTVRDAIVQSLALVLGAAKRVTAPGSGLAGSVVATQDQRLTQLSGTVLGAVQLANDPILEDLVGFPVVAELKEGDRWREITGLLKDYSAEWIEVWDARWTEEHRIEIPAGGDAAVVERRNVAAEQSEDGRLVVRNNDPRRSLRLVSIRVGDGGEARPLDRLRVGPGESWECPFAAPVAEPVVLDLLIVTRTDLALPRAEAIVRHAAPAEAMRWRERLRVVLR